MKCYLFTGLIVLTLAFLLMGSVGAQSNTYELDGAITGGSSAFNAGAYTMNATLGQSAVRTLEGGGYTLGGGVFGGGDTSEQNSSPSIYLPIVVR